jgi:hypothetical protein
MTDAACRRGLVGRRETVEPREDHALYRPGDRRTVRAAAQELREKQRIALCALDAAQRHVRIGGEKGPRECKRIRIRQWREIEPDDLAHRPTGSDRVSLAPRCQNHDARHPSRTSNSRSAPTRRGPAVLDQ